MSENLGVDVAQLGRTYQLRPKKAGPKTLVALQDGCDWKRELAFELIAVSGIRDSKQRRFRRAILGALGFYLLFCAVAIGGAALRG